jgi:hypothetical protein
MAKQYAGKTRKKMHKSQKMRKSVGWKGWSKEKPSYKQRSVMFKRCPKKCFLGPNKSFPICKKNTCDVSDKGLWAAYVRSKEWGNKRITYTKRGKPTMKRSVYKNVSRKSKKMLKKRGFKVN